jgi:hypothetical protein
MTHALITQGEPDRRLVRGSENTYLDLTLEIGCPLVVRGDACRGRVDRRDEVREGRGLCQLANELSSNDLDLQIYMAFMSAELK